MVLHSMTNIYYSQTVLVVWWNQNCCLEITPTSWQTSISVWNGIRLFRLQFYLTQVGILYVVFIYLYSYAIQNLVLTTHKLNVIRKPTSHLPYYGYMWLYRGNSLFLCSESALCALLLEHKSLALVTLAQIFDVLCRYLNTKIR